MKPLTPFQTKLLKILLPVLFWLAVWIFASFQVGQELLLPSPAAVVRRLVELAATKIFWRSTGLSLLRIFCGTAAGTALGTLCAVLTCRFKLVDWALSPAIRIVRATPVASFIILVLLWVRTGMVPGVISCLMVLPVIWESVSAGIRCTDPLLLEMSACYRLSPGKKLCYVYFPEIKPHFTSGLCSAIGLAWKSGVAAEVLCLPKAAIGTQVYYAKIYLESPSLFAWTGVVIVLSLALERLVRWVLLGKGGGKA